jgi:hypothetical protein
MKTRVSLPSLIQSRLVQPTPVAQKAKSRRIYSFFKPFKIAGKRRMEILLFSAEPQQMAIQ